LKEPLTLSAIATTANLKWSDFETATTGWKVKVAAAPVTDGTAIPTTDFCSMTIYEEKDKTLIP